MFAKKSNSEISWIEILRYFGPTRWDCTRFKACAFHTVECKHLQIELVVCSTTLTFILRIKLMETQFHKMRHGLSQIHRYRTFRNTCFHSVTRTLWGTKEIRIAKTKRLFLYEIAKPIWVLCVLTWTPARSRQQLISGNPGAPPLSNPLPAAQDVRHWALK